ncbi:hypothetical protein B0H12DRAFT_1322084 [Mycena haematopus]|nr:hypothetical protein B0H12DRAFT_1322084 [Mycena haematopus]
MLTDDEEDAVKMKEYSDTAKTVYQTVSEEFYDWKQAHNAKVFARLAHPAASPAKLFCLPPACFEPLPRPTHSDSNVMHLYSYSADGSIVKSESVPMSVYPVVDSGSFPPHPPYQYCSAASRSENARMIDNKNAPFVPFPEDPTFPRSEYLSCFETYQWKDDQRDPDEEVIQYETVRRLHITHHFTAELIDEGNATQMLFRPLRLSNESGLLWDVSQRDLLNVVWGDGLPSSSKEHPQLPPCFGQKSPRPDDIFEQINRGIEKFCPNLNCIQNNCHVHVDYQWEFITPRLKPKHPHRTSEGLRALAEAPCGDECFLNIPEDAMEDDSTDDVPIDRNVLYGILDIEPDMLPCDLAVICRMVCRIAFVLRKQAIDDEDVWEDPTDKRRPKKKPKLHFCTCCLKHFRIGNIQHPSMQPVKSHRSSRATTRDHALAHVVSASSSEDTVIGTAAAKKIVCAAGQVATQPVRGMAAVAWGRNASAVLRIANVTQKSVLRVVHGLFPFTLQYKISDLCRNMDTRCTNVSLRLGRFKRFEVKKSKYGLGAFAAETIRKGEVIGEYVGELIDEKEEDLGHRAVIHNHSKLNYCFDIKGVSIIIDAQWLGNPTRFLNDSKPAPANCGAYDIVVNAERRIGIHALEPIRKGAELTLEYGHEYWNKHAKEEENQQH